MPALDTRAYPFPTDRLDVDLRYRDLRRDEPLIRVQLTYGEPAWLVTRHADAKIVLGDSRFSRAAAMGRDEPRTMAFVSGPEAMINLDPPEHSRLRRLVMPAFTMRRRMTCFGDTP